MKPKDETLSVQQMTLPYGCYTWMDCFDNVGDDDDDSDTW